MNEQRIEVIISPTGQTRVETKGFGGRDCLQATKFLEAALGHRQSDRLTSEYFEAKQLAELHQQN
ncbi:unnamed protein product [marine sediment metagenome]|uniref:DUF2997 domain-containing protein n=1 Tax=marine sediment metagenome TaxID=412755 RepID=X0UI18_9ZZZZ